MAPKDEGSEFKPGQELMWVGMLYGDGRIDVPCIYLKDHHRKDTHVWIRVNGTEIVLDKAKLVDSIAYWKAKNGSSA